MLLRIRLLRSRVGDSQEQPSPTYRLKGAPFHMQPMHTHWHQAVQDRKFSED